MRELRNLVVALGMVVKALGALLLKVVGVAANTLYGFTMFVASDLVNEAENSTKARKVQLFFVYPTVIIIVALLAYCYSSDDITIPQECTLTKCVHYDVDYHGNYTQVDFFDCDIHGHDCPQED